MNEPPSLLRNDLKGTHHWLKVKLIGTKSNRSAIGARVLARYGGRAQAQEVLSQSSLLLLQRLAPAFRTGQAANADLAFTGRVVSTEKYPNVKCDQLVTIQEAHGIIPNRGWARK